MLDISATAQTVSIPLYREERREGISCVSFYRKYQPCLKAAYLLQNSNSKGKKTTHLAWQKNLPDGWIVAQASRRHSQFTL